MEAKPNGRVQRSALEWQQILNRFAESGRSRAAFCRAEGISPATFDVWQRKLGAKQAAKKAAREFVELTPVSAPTVGGDRAAGRDAGSNPRLADAVWSRGAADPGLSTADGHAPADRRPGRSGTGFVLT